MSPWLTALVICALAAALEAVFAGSDVRPRFNALRMPRWAPSLRIWIVIGIGYYVICFMVLVRVLSLASSSARTLALTLILTVLAVNGFWNFLFFRLGDLRLSFVTSVAYSTAALYLLQLLRSLDPIAAVWLSPYAVYLVYANAFGYAVWRENPVKRETR